MSKTPQNFEALIAQGPITIRQARAHLDKLIAACQAEGLDTAPIDDIPAALDRLEAQVKAYTTRIKQFYIVGDER